MRKIGITLDEIKKAEKSKTEKPKDKTEGGDGKDEKPKDKTE